MTPEDLTDPTIATPTVPSSSPSAPAVGASPAAVPVSGAVPASHVDLAPVAPAAAASYGATSVLASPVVPSSTAQMPLTPPSPGGHSPTVSGGLPPVQPDSGSGRSKNRLVLAVGAALLLVLVVAAAGLALLNADSEATVTSSDTGVVFEEEFLTDNSESASSAVEPEGTIVDEESLPSSGSDAAMPDASVEPVAFVARKVGPSVVLLQTAIGQGSGIIYDESGLIVTNAHVVGTASQLEVVLASGFKLQGTVVGADAERDVAVVSFDPDTSGIDFAVADIGLLETVEVGQLAVAIGSPFGLDQTVTSGIVSALGRPIPGLSTPVQMIQTDASINPGNSGGALVDREGRVIGMNTSIRTDGLSSTNAGVGFAIPADTFLDIANRLVNGLSLESGFLGVSISDPTVGEAGALVSRVDDATPAQQGGVEVGDLIVGVDGQRITGTAELRAAITLGQPGSATSVEVLRNGERLQLEVVLGSQ